MSYQGVSSLSSPVFVIEPQTTLVDEPVDILLGGLEPGQKIRVRAITHDDRGHTWEAWALFRADNGGLVDVRAQVPEDGTYRDVDAMGLFWSMCPITTDEPGLTPFTRASLRPLRVTFAVEADRKLIVETQIERCFVGPGVVSMPLRDKELVGTFFLPDAPGPCPAVLLLGGSSGTLLEQQAALLASRGYCALALAYFSREHLPQELVEIPLEYFEKALRWLQASERVNPDKIAVLGLSKGSEAALLLGATFPTIKAVVGYAPSAVILQGLASTESTSRKSSWSYQGKPLPFIPYDDSPVFNRYIYECRQGDLPIAFTPHYLASLRGAIDVERAAIPVEKIHGPLLLISGHDDQMWPSTPFGDMIEQRLEQHLPFYPYHHQHLAYTEAGHKIGIPYLPTTSLGQSRHPVAGMICAYGGSPEGNARASKQSWSALRTFLKESLS